jgi:hypothetical protein
MVPVAAWIPGDLLGCKASEVPERLGEGVLFRGGELQETATYSYVFSTRAWAQKTKEKVTER